MKPFTFSEYYTEWLESFRKLFPGGAHAAKDLTPKAWSIALRAIRLAAATTIDSAALADMRQPAPKGSSKTWQEITDVFTRSHGLRGDSGQLSVDRFGGVNVFPTQLLPS